MTRYIYIRLYIGDTIFGTNNVLSQFLEILFC